MSYVCPKCDRPYSPFDITEAWVEIDSPITHITEDGHPSGYTLVGYTHEIDGALQSIGYGCMQCGDVFITRERIRVGGKMFSLHPVDRFGR